ncbi:unnamed protein product, partial [Laminaria digitata]
GFHSPHPCGHDCAYTHKGTDAPARYHRAHPPAPNFCIELVAPIFPAVVHTASLRPQSACVNRHTCRVYFCEIPPSQLQCHSLPQSHLPPQPVPLYPPNANSTPQRIPAPPTLPHQTTPHATATTPPTARATIAIYPRLPATSPTVTPATMTTRSPNHADATATVVVSTAVATTSELRRPWRLCRSPVIIATVAARNRRTLATLLKPAPTCINASLGLLREHTPSDEHYLCWTAGNHLVMSDADQLSVECACIVTPACQSR